MCRNDLTNVKKAMLEIYSQEYVKHRDEIQNRINIQNNMSQRGLYLTALVITLLASVFTYFMKEANQPQSNDSQNISKKNQTKILDSESIISKSTYSTIRERNLQSFYSMSVPIIIIYSLLLELVLASWIYQLGMSFRIVRYWNWLTVKKIEPILNVTNELYIWDRPPDNAEWILEVDKGIFKYFQAIFLYMLCFIGQLSQLLIIILKIYYSAIDIWYYICVFGFIVLSYGLYILCKYHLKIHNETNIYRAKHFT